MTLGSEFQPVAVLVLLCSLHPLWPWVHHWLTDGISYLLNPLWEDDQIADLTTMLKCSNHKSAIFHHDQLVQMLAAEVEWGWQLILPCLAALLFPGEVIAPLGMVLQDSINKWGEIIQKWWLTHDQSFNTILGTQ